jgi:hypothetical protein
VNNKNRFDIILMLAIRKYLSHNRQNLPVAGKNGSSWIFSSSSIDENCFQGAQSVAN